METASGKMHVKAHMEPFLANFKAERIHRREEFQTKDEFWGVIPVYVNFYTCQRISSTSYTAPEHICVSWLNKTERAKLVRFLPIIYWYTIGVKKQYAINVCVEYAMSVG